MYTEEEEVIHFIFKAFNNMKRKKENVGLAFHSIMVGNMLKNIGCDQKTIIIGYLHDIIEDSEYNYDFLINKYGKDIANGVLLLSQDNAIEDYVERKKYFIKKIKNADTDIILVELADKLQNLVSDYDLYIKCGDNALITESHTFEESAWYHKELQKIFNEKLNSNRLLERYNEIVKIYFK